MFESSQLPQCKLPGTPSLRPCPSLSLLFLFPVSPPHLSHSPEAASVETSPAPESSWLRPHGSSPISGCPAAHASTPSACCSWSWSSPSCLICIKRSGAGTGAPEPKKGRVYEYTESGPLSPGAGTHPAKEMDLTKVKQQKSLVGRESRSKRGL